MSPKPTLKGLSEDDLDALVETIVERVSEEIAEKAADKAVSKLTNRAYAEIGRGVVSKFLWIVGLSAAGLYLWLKQQGYIHG